MRSLGEDLFRKSTDDKISRIDTYTQQEEVLGLYANNNFLPCQLMKNRNDALKWLQYMMQSKYDPSDVHYYVFTFGGRRTIDELEADWKRCKDRLRKLRLLLSEYQMEDMFTSWEYTYCKETETFHLHANMLIYYHHGSQFVMGRDSKKMYERMAKKVGGTVENNGAIRDVRECVKYVIKGNDLLSMPDATLLRLYRFQKGKQFVSWGKRIAKRRKDYENRGIALYFHETEVRRRNIEHHHNARPDRIITQKAKRENPEKTVMKNIILSVSPPSYGMGLFKTGGIIVMNYDPDDENTKEQLLDIQMYFDEAAEIGKAKGMPTPAQVMELDGMLLEGVATDVIDELLNKYVSDAQERLYDEQLKIVLERQEALEKKSEGSRGVHKGTVIVPSVIDVLETSIDEADEMPTDPPPKSILQSIFTDITLTSPDNDLPF